MTAPALDFDRLIDRRSLPSEKWGRYAGRDVLPLWVADMDFAAPPAVLDALHRRIDHGVFGYTDAWPSLIEAVVAGLQRDHGWTIQPDWLVWLPGVVAGFNLACAIAGEAGDGVLTATPVYPPFLTAPANTGRVLQRVEMMLRDGRWQRLPPPSTRRRPTSFTKNWSRRATRSFWSIAAATTPIGN